MKMYCCEFENTKDGTFNYELSNILNRQLIFTRQLHRHQREHQRWVEYDTDDAYADVDVKRKFEAKFGVVVKFESFDDPRLPKAAWIIYEKDEWAKKEKAANATNKATLDGFFGKLTH